VRRPVVALALALGIALGAAAVARADDSPTVSAPAAKGSGTGPFGTEDVPPPVDPSLLVERHLPGPEILHEKPSGFWTSNRPAVGGAYRYRLLLLGVAIAALMAALIFRTIRRHGRRPA
jgi:hypothetical protein